MRRELKAPLSPKAARTLCSNALLFPPREEHFPKTLESVFSATALLYVLGEPLTRHFCIALGSFL